MEPLTNKLTDRELIEECEKILKEEPEFSELYHDVLSKLLTRFKSLIENRSELVEKCVLAIDKLNDTHYYAGSWPNKDELRTALQKLFEK